MGRGKKLNRDRFIKISNNIHNDKYDYSLVVYATNFCKNNNTNLLRIKYNRKINSNKILKEIYNYE